MHCRLHQLHDAHGDQYFHCQSGGGRLSGDPVLSATDGGVGRDDDLVLWRNDVQGGALLSGGCVD